MRSDIKLEGVEITLNIDWHDGPLSGFCMYQGKEYWYHASDILDSGLWTYNVHECPPDQRAFEEKWTETFKAVRNDEMRKNLRKVYYEQRPKLEDINKWPIIGWFEM